MMQNLELWAFFAGLYYGIGILTLTDISIAILYALPSLEKLFQPCHYMGNAILASSLVYSLYPQWKIIFLHDEGVNRRFEWHISLFSLLWMGFGFANAIVYPTECICAIYTSLDAYTFDRLLLAAPCGIVLYSFAEVWGWNSAFRAHLLRA
jgi:hypothetical protein